MRIRNIVPFVVAVLAAGLPSVAHAYVGPGAGLSLAAAFWAILVAVGTIVGFTLLWPIRRLLRRRGARASQRTQAGADGRSAADGEARS
ncbi:MAG: hypothetical protein RLO51_20575 [Thalassobaculum sp.]|uniref:hypothetical protein n=1 Tax=Thalassobaculum sp. TaxID=2022740 RepID=UPI0032EEC2D3